MLLEIYYGDDRIPVEISTKAGQKKILLEGQEVPCDWLRLPSGQYSVILDGRVFDMTVEIAGDDCTVSARHETISLRIIDPRRLGTLPVVEKGEVGLRSIVAEMPGKVIRLLVKPGDAVVHDQGLLVIEAMKMQNEIRAPKGGVVKEIGVTEGKAVNSGDFLLSLE